MKTILLLALVLLINNFVINAQCSNWTDAQWYIGSTYGSHKITPCDDNAIYNCHGFVLSYFEDDCRPGITSTIAAPYTCPTEQGEQGGIVSNVKFIQVPSNISWEVVSYELHGGTTHSAVKAVEGSLVKYISKYGDDGPLVSHNLDSSFYHLSPSWLVTGKKYLNYIGSITGDTDIEGIGNVNFSILNKSGVSYSWSIVSGSSNIYISSGSNQSTVTLRPIHSGNATLKLVAKNSTLDLPKTQTIDLTIDTQICLEGTYVNGGSTTNLSTGNSVSVGSVSTTVSCPGATSYTWTRTSGSISYYSSGNFMSFTMTSGSSMSFQIKAKNSSNQVIGTRNVAYYNYGSFAVFPNPATSTFEIDVAEDEELDIIVLDGTSLSKIKNIKMYKSKEKIDVSGWKKGEYILHIYHRGELVKKDRLIVE